MVCTTPLFRAVKNKYPGSRVYVFGNKINEKLLQNNSDVDKYIVEEGSVSDIAKRLKEMKIDFACITGPNFKILASLYLAGIKTITAPKIENGFSPLETKAYNILKKFIISKPHRMGYYAPREYLRLLESIDIFTEDTQKYLSFSEEANNRVSKYLKEQNIDEENDLIIGLSPSVGNKVKAWSPEKFAKLTDYIYEKYSARIIIPGTDIDKTEVEEMIKSLNEKTKVINALSVFDLDELKALISRIAVYISVDSGPIYIAEAFKVATVDIVGPLDEREQPPIGLLNKIVKMDNRESVLHLMDANPCDSQEARRQVDEITVGMVVEKVDELMEQISNLRGNKM